MRMRDVIRLMATFLKIDIVLEIDMFGGTKPMEQMNPQQHEIVNFLVYCINLAYQEIAADYIPLKYIQTIEVVDGVYKLHHLNEKLINVLSIKDQNSKNVKYKLYPTDILLPSGTFTIEYTYRPVNLVSPEEDVVNAGGRLNERILAYGALREYCLINSLYEDANMWHKRFEDGLVAVTRKKSLIKTPARRWG